MHSLHHQAEPGRNSRSGLGSLFYCPACGVNSEFSNLKNSHEFMPIQRNNKISFLLSLDTRLSLDAYLRFDSVFYFTPSPAALILPLIT